MAPAHDCTEMLLAEAGVGRLVARYCDAVARFDRELFASLWTPDAVWATTRGDIVGRERITATYVKLRSGYEFSIQSLLSGTVDVAPDGGSARARWQIRELGRTTSGEGMELYGVYTDDCVPAVDAAAEAGPGAEPGRRWQFARRRFDPLYRSAIVLTGDATPFPRDAEA